MDLKELQSHWQAFGKQDPMWAILTAADKKAKWREEEFFATGEHDVGPVIEAAISQKLLLNRGTALDFGCGIGRLTQAMCKYFDETVGVDIAPSMIELANKYNKFEDRCGYKVCETLDEFKNNSFDFIFSILVLQHNEPKYSKEYIRDFIRILKPGGLCVFQIPSSRTTYIENKNTFPRMEMHGISTERIREILSEYGGEIVSIHDASILTPGWTGFIYWVTK